MRSMILTGFLGGLTTFSSFVFHNEQMLAHQQWVSFAISLLMRNGIGIIAVWLGIRHIDLTIPLLPAVKP